MKKPCTLERFKESTAQPGSLRVDRDAGVIHGVKVLGSESKNGRKYSPNAMDQARKLYEGTSVNIDHKYEGERSIVEGFGELKELKLMPDGVYGDLHYLKSHPLAEPVLERAERFPRSFGMSHDAEGEVVRAGGEFVVESLEKVFSVDLVATPATTEGLFESRQQRQKLMKRKLREAVAAAPKTNVLRKLLEMEMEQMPELAEMEYEIEEMDGMEEPSGGDQVKAAFRALVMSVLDDDSLSPDAMAEKLKSLLTMQADAQAVVEGGNPEEMMEEEGGDEMKKTVESLRKQVDDLKRLIESKSMSEQVDVVLAARGVTRAKLTESQTKILAKQTDLETARELIESWEFDDAETFPRRVQSGRASSVGSYDEERKRTSFVTPAGYRSGK